MAQRPKYESVISRVHFFKIPAHLVEVLFVLVGAKQIDSDYVGAKTHPSEVNNLPLIPITWTSCNKIPTTGINQSLPGSCNAINPLLANSSKPL